MTNLQKAPTYRCLNCGYVPNWGHLEDKFRYVPGSWSCPAVLVDGALCQKDRFWAKEGFHYNDWYSKEYSQAYRKKYGKAEWKNGVNEELF